MHWLDALRETDHDDAEYYPVDYWDYDDYESEEERKRREADELLAEFEAEELARLEAEEDEERCDECGDALYDPLEYHGLRVCSFCYDDFHEEQYEDEQPIRRGGEKAPWEDD